jgi:hypothetical protein
MSKAAPNVPGTIRVHVPLKFTIRGGRKTIIGQAPTVAHATPRTRFDDSIVKALARAYRWRSQIEDGTYASITELAKEQGVNQSYACRMLRLTLLSPSIVESLLDRRGTNLTLEALMKPLPAIWHEQLPESRLQR